MIPSNWMVRTWVIEPWKLSFGYMDEILTFYLYFALVSICKRAQITLTFYYHPNNLNILLPRECIVMVWGFLPAVFGVCDGQKSRMKSIYRNGLDVCKVGCLLNLQETSMSGIKWMATNGALQRHYYLCSAYWKRQRLSVSQTSEIIGGGLMRSGDVICANMHSLAHLHAIGIWKKECDLHLRRYPCSKLLIPYSQSGLLTKV